MYNHRNPYRDQNKRNRKAKAVYITIHNIQKYIRIQKGTSIIEKLSKLTQINRINHNNFFYIFT